MPTEYFFNIKRVTQFVALPASKTFNQMFYLKILKKLRELKHSVMAFHNGDLAAYTLCIYPLCKAVFDLKKNDTCVLIT